MAEKNVSVLSPDSAIKAATALGTATLGFLAIMNLDQKIYAILFFVNLLCGAGLILPYFVPSLFSRKNDVLDATGAQHTSQYPWVVPLRWALACIILIGFVVGIAWYCFGAVFMPSAAITRFERSEIMFMVGAGNPKTYEVTPPAFFLATHDAKNLEEIRATPYALLTITRNGDLRTKSLRIEAVEFQVKHTPYVKVEARYGVGPKNIVLPTRYSAWIRPDVTKTKALMVDVDGNPIEGTIVLDKDNSFVDLHVTFTSKAKGHHLYEIRPTITVVDDTGTGRTTLTYDQALYIAVNEIDE